MSPDCGMKGNTGKGIVTAVVDDGLDYESQDLHDNFNCVRIVGF